MDDYKEIFVFFKFIMRLLDPIDRNTGGLAAIFSKCHLPPVHKVKHLSDEAIHQTLTSLQVDSRVYECLKVVGQGLLLTIQEGQSKAATRVCKQSATFVKYIHQFRKTEYFNNQILDTMFWSFFVNILKMLKKYSHPSEFRQPTFMRNSVVHIMAILVKYGEFIDILLNGFLEELIEFLALDKVEQQQKIYYVFHIVYALDLALQKPINASNQIDVNSDGIKKLSTVLLEIQKLHTNTATDYLIGKIMNYLIFGVHR